MIKSDITAPIREHFPGLSHPDLLESINEVGELKSVDAGTKIMEIGGHVKVMPLVTKGALKVLREDEDGGELFLYFLYPGQSCAMTVQCCVADAPSQVRAVAEEDTEMVLIPVGVVDPWIRKHPGWKDFILNTYADRFSELLHTIDSVVFHKLDERLHEYLLEKSRAAGAKSLTVTHQELADDLHSSREVISRLLKQLEKSGKIKLARNKVELL